MIRADEKQKRLLLYFYVRDVEKKVINWETYEADLYHKEKTTSPLIKFTLQDTYYNPTFAILNTSMFAFWEGIDPQKYGLIVQSFDISDAISAGKTCVIRNPDSKELPEALITPLVFIYENKLYAFGIPASYSSKIDAALFDPTIGSWKELPSAPHTSSNTNRYRPRYKSTDENRIYPAFIQEREKKVVLGLKDLVYFFNLVECTWTEKDDWDWCFGMGHHRNGQEQAVVIGDFLYTCEEWDLTCNLKYLRAYNLKDSAWLEDGYLILPPFIAQFVLLSQIGENTICLVFSSLDTTEGRRTTRLDWIKADLITAFDKNTRATFVEAHNVDGSPVTLQYQGELFSCLPLCSPVNEIAKKISIRYAGNKRQRELSAGDLDFIN